MKLISICMFLFVLLSGSDFASASTYEDSVEAMLTMVVTRAGPNSTPIRDARLIVIDSKGNMVANVVSNTEGRATISVTVPRDFRFPWINMGFVTVIAIANGYNEFIHFSVPINEFNDGKARVNLPLRKIVRQSRNEPDFINGSFHRFTVFRMLDFYAEKIGLIRQKVFDKMADPPPWSPDRIK